MPKDKNERIAERKKRIRDRRANFTLNNKLIDAMRSWLENNRNVPLETIQDFDTFVKAFGLPAKNGVSIRASEVPVGVQEQMLDYVHRVFFEQDNEDGFNNFMDYLYHFAPNEFRANGKSFTELAEEVMPGSLKGKNIDAYARMDSWFEHKGLFDNWFSDMSEVVNGKKDIDSTNFLRLLIQANRLDRYIKGHKDDFDRFDYFKDLLYVKKPGRKGESQINPETIKKLNEMGINTREITGAFYAGADHNENGTLYTKDTEYPSTNLDEQSARKVVESVDSVASAVLVKFAIDKLGAYKRKFITTRDQDDKVVEKVIIEGEKKPLAYNELSKADQKLLAKLMCRSDEDLKEVFDKVATRAQSVYDLVMRHVDDDLLKFRPFIKNKDRIVPEDMYANKKDSTIPTEYDIHINNLINTILNNSIKYGAFAKPVDEKFGDVEFEFALAQSLTDPKVTTLFSQAALNSFVEGETMGQPKLYQTKYPKSYVEYSTGDGKKVQEPAGKVKRYVSGGLVNLNGRLYPVANLPVRPALKGEFEANDQFELCISDEEFADVIKQLGVDNKMSFGDITRKDISIGKNTLALDLVEHATKTIVDISTQDKVEFTRTVEEEQANLKPLDAHSLSYTAKDNKYHFIDFSCFKDPGPYNEIREQAFKQVKDMNTILNALRIFEERYESEFKEDYALRQQTVADQNATTQEVLNHYRDKQADKEEQQAVVFNAEQAEKESVVNDLKDQATDWTKDKEARLNEITEEDPQLSLDFEQEEQDLAEEPAEAPVEAPAQEEVTEETSQDYVIENPVLDISPEIIDEIRAAEEQVEIPTDEIYLDDDDVEIYPEDDKAKQANEAEEAHEAFIKNKPTKRRVRTAVVQEGVTSKEIVGKGAVEETENGKTVYYIKDEETGELTQTSRKSYKALTQKVQVDTKDQPELGL